jgi:hypothetical protein
MIRRRGTICRAITGWVVAARVKLIHPSLVRRRRGVLPAVDTVDGRYRPFIYSSKAIRGIVDSKIRRSHSGFIFRQEANAERGSGCWWGTSRLLSRRNEGGKNELTKQAPRSNRPDRMGKRGKKSNGGGGVGKRGRGMGTLPSRAIWRIKSAFQATFAPTRALCGREKRNRRQDKVGLGHSNLH